MRFNYAGGMLPLSMEKGGQTYYFAYDQVGSLRLVTDSSGSVVKQIDYDSFGNIITETNAAFTVPFGFAGGLHDRDTGLVRFGLRDYDPDTGRWTAKDPLLFDGGDTDLYGYVLNNPVNYFDPFGLSPLKIVKRWVMRQLIKLPFSKIPGIGGYFEVGTAAGEKIYEDLTGHQERLVDAMERSGVPEDFYEFEYRIDQSEVEIPSWFRYWPWLRRNHDVIKE